MKDDLIERLQAKLDCGLPAKLTGEEIQEIIEAITRIEELERQLDEALKEMQRVAQIEYKGDRIRKMISTKRRIQEMKDE